MYVGVLPSLALPAQVGEAHQRESHQGEGVEAHFFFQQRHGPHQYPGKMQRHWMLFVYIVGGSKESKLCERRGGWIPKG